MKKKLIISLSGLVVVLLTFSLTGSALAERIDFSELPSPVQGFIGQVIALNPANFGEAPKYYDLLVKKVQTGSGKGAYQPGDIVTAKPYGHKWSSTEKQNFWIVKMYLTETQVQELTSPKQRPLSPEELKERGIDEGEAEEEMETVARRKYHIPPEAIEQLKEGGIIKKDFIKERDTN